MLLYGKPVVAHLKHETQSFISDNGLQGRYVAFLLLSDDKPSAVYVNLKAKYAHDIGLESKIIDQQSLSAQQVIDNIATLNGDDDCIGIVVQLPLPDHLATSKADILCSVAPHKDVDGLGGTLFGLSSVGKIDFTPATPKAVLEILKYYELDDYQGKMVTVLGQSNLVGKPLAMDFIKRGATVFSFNDASDQEMMKRACHLSDIIVSATGVLGLVDESFLSLDPGNQVIVDVGRGIKDGKAVGDVQWRKLEERVQAITPVPGGVGPVTVACLFHNIIALQGLAL